MRRRAEARLRIAHSAPALDRIGRGCGKLFLSLFLGRQLTILTSFFRITAGK